MHRLKITNCKNHIEELTLKDGSYTIGRELDSALRLESNGVSRLHARLLIGRTNCEIIDEDSTNGTFVNGNRITSHPLANGDKIQIDKFNLEFYSERPHHIPALTGLQKPALTGLQKPTDFILEDTTKKGRKIIYTLLVTALILTSLIIYQRISWNRKWLKSQIQLAETTARYFAERNKEALYLGEYRSLDLTNLSPCIKEIAIIDRRGKIQAYQPPETEPLLIDTEINSAKLTHKDKHTLEIHTPIYYDSTRVGTLWMIYSITRHT